MSRINTNVGSMLARRILGQQNQALTKSLERLSTGLAINRGADDPAGLIASEKLRSEKVAIDAAIGNAERADQVVNIAEGGLQEVHNLLQELQGLIGQSANEAGLSQEELEANQLQVDSILQTIDRIAQTTSFEGVKLLNGTYDFTVVSQSTMVEDLQVNAAKLSHGDNRAIQTVVTQSAQHAGLAVSADGAGVLNFGGDASKRFVFEIAGTKGSREFTFASGTKLSAIRDSVNTFTSVTGVSASINAGAGTLLTFKSVGFGSDEFVSFKMVDDAGQTGDVVFLSGDDTDKVDGTTAQAFSAITNPIRDEGQDVGAIINGVSAKAKGKIASINTDYLSLSVDMAVAGAQSEQEFTAFRITGGGAQFNLGPQVDLLNQTSVGIQNVAVRNLGRYKTGGNTYYLDDLSNRGAGNVVTGDKALAQNVVSSAIDSVSSLRGRLGAFQKNIVGATIRSLGVALENTSAAESSIRDTDFASETAELTRSQILVNAATNVLALANQQPQNVLSLLG
jgi:flagellin